MKQEGFSTAFERLDREIQALRRMCALGTLFAWNWESKLTQGRARRWVWTLGHRRVELLVGALVAVMALCACEEKDRTPTRVVDPGPPFPDPRPTLRSAHTLQDGSVLLVVTR